MIETVLNRGRQRYGITEYRCAVYRFCGSGNGSGIENFCGTVLRYKFLEPAVNGIGSGIDFRKKRYTVTVKVLNFSLKIPRFLANTADTASVQIQISKKKKDPEKTENTFCNFI